MFSFVKNFDVYPKTFDEFKERTFSGAAISLISIACIFVLIVAEVNWYRNIDRVDELYVDTHMGGKITIYLNITFPNVGCDVLSLDAMDGFGESQADITHDIYKVRLDREGKLLEKRKETQLGETDSDIERAKKAVVATQAENYCGSCHGAEEYEGQCCNTCDAVREAYRKKRWAFTVHDGVEQCIKEKIERQAKATAEEGCNIHGHLAVNKVQGNFHFAPGRSFTEAGSHVHDFLPFELEAFNVSHTVHQLGFGAEYPGLVNPMDNQSRMVIGPSGNFQYFIKVVPTVFEPLGGPMIETNQYSVTEHFKPRSGLGGANVIPGVFFIYDTSPILVHIREQKRHASFFHFLTNLCAIVGGVFTVSGIVDRLWHHSYRALQAKAHIGKAG